MVDFDKIRSDFPILNQKINGKNLVYLDNSATTQKPKPVIESITDFYSKMNCNVHRSVYQLSQEASNSYETVRKIVKDFINAKKTQEIVFTSGTTESINLVANSFGSFFLKKGDEIIISEMEHHSNIVPWQMLCKQKSANLKIIPVLENGSLDIEKIKKLLSEKTKFISVTYVSNVT